MATCTYSAVQLTAAAPVGTSLNLGKATELFDIEVEQIAGSGMFIADQKRSRLEIANAVQPQTAQDAADGSTAESGALGNVKTGEALARSDRASRPFLPADTGGSTWRRCGGKLERRERQP